MDKPGAAGRARSRQDACTSDGCAEGGAKRGANARALHARRHADEQQADPPDGPTRGTAACSESTAIIGVSPSRPEAQSRSRRIERRSAVRGTSEAKRRDDGGGQTTTQK